MHGRRWIALLALVAALAPATAHAATPAEVVAQLRAYAADAEAGRDAVRAEAAAQRRAERAAARRRAAARAAAAHARVRARAERQARTLRRLVGGDPSWNAVARARRRGHVSAADARRYAGRLSWLRRAKHRASGRRRAELAGVLGGVRALAARGDLTPSRMSAVFLQAKRNAQFWPTARLPAAGDRFSFRGDPVVFEYVAGHGLQIHPLANFAKANKLRNACVGVNTAPGVPCEKRKLRRLLGRMLALQSNRGGFAAWEYLFPAQGGSAPWISAMTQGTAMQALSRGARLLGDRRYLRAAGDALAAFDRPTPIGVRVPAGGGRTHFAMYSFAPGLRVLNGFLQSVSGLHTYAKVSNADRAWRLFRAGDREARAIIPGFKSGDWSLYSRPGAKASVEYHELARDFLRNLCKRVGGKAYCRWEDTFTAQLRARG